MVKLTIQDTTLTIPHCTVNVSGGHKITSSQVLHGGVIKEHISRADYKINISGTLVDEKVALSKEDFLNTNIFESLDTSDFPEKDVFTVYLAILLQYNGAVKIYHPNLLGTLGIQTVVIDSYTLPYTPGKNNQDITINCTSDYVIYKPNIIRTVKPPLNISTSTDVTKRSPEQPLIYSGPPKKEYDLKNL